MKFIELLLLKLTIILLSCFQIALSNHEMHWDTFCFTLFNLRPSSDLHKTCLWKGRWHVTKVAEQKTSIWYVPLPTWLMHTNRLATKWRSRQALKKAETEKRRGVPRPADTTAWTGGAQRQHEWHTVRQLNEFGFYQIEPGWSWVRKGHCLALKLWLSNHSWHLNMWTGSLTPQQTSAKRL